MKKYELTGETLQFQGRTLHRIRALHDFEKGGFATMNLENGMIVGAEKYDAQQRVGRAYFCPVCGKEIFGDSVLYKDGENGEIFACEHCIRETDAWTEYGL